MPQLLHLQNGDSVVNKIRSGDGRLTKLLKENKTEAEVVEELYLATLSRPAPEDVKKLVHQQLTDAPDRGEVYRDLFWALLNSKEFSFNH